MASDIFIKIDGIAGESNDAKHKDEIEVSDWKWSIEQASNMHSGSGGGAGKAAVGDLLFWHQVDRASPNLTKFCLTGNHIAHAKLTVRKAGGSPLEFYKIAMSDVIVTKVNPISNEEGVFEQVGLSFAKVTQEYILQNAQGGSGGVVTAAFDIKKNVDC